ncbi:MAG: type IV pili methyl-accepting chemotaxis transducer N-terminal domain-containing protein, partial [Burkholderiales bacterium]
MKLSRQRLSTKLVEILVFFLLVALVSIGITLLMSWDLQGGAAAVNQAGSERMRAYRISMLLTQAELPGVDRERTLAAASAEAREFERVLDELKLGDPSRPLFLPNEKSIRDQFNELESIWSDS